MECVHSDPASQPAGPTEVAGGGPALLVLSAVLPPQAMGGGAVGDGRGGGRALRRRVHLIPQSVLAKEEVDEPGHAPHHLVEDLWKFEEGGNRSVHGLTGCLLERRQSSKHRGIGHLHRVAQGVEHPEPALDQGRGLDALQDLRIVHVLLGQVPEVGQVAGRVEVAGEGEGEGEHELAPLLGQAGVVPPVQAQLPEGLPEARRGEEHDAGSQPCLEQHMDQQVREHGAQAGPRDLHRRREEGVSHCEQVSGDGLPGLLRELGTRPHEDGVRDLEHASAQVEVRVAGVHREGEVCRVHGPVPRDEELAEVVEDDDGIVAGVLHDRRRDAVARGEESRQPVLVNIDTGGDEVVGGERQAQAVAHHLHRPLHLLSGAQRAGRLDCAGSLSARLQDVHQRTDDGQHHFPAHGGREDVQDVVRRGALLNGVREGHPL